LTPFSLQADTPARSRLLRLNSGLTQDLLAAAGVGGNLRSPVLCRWRQLDWCYGWSTCFTDSNILEEAKGDICSLVHTIPFGLFRGNWW